MPKAIGSLLDRNPDNERTFSLDTLELVGGIGVLTMFTHCIPSQSSSLSHSSIH